MGKFNIKSLFVEETNTDDEVKDTTVETSNNSNNKPNVESNVSTSNVQSPASIPADASVNSEKEEVNQELLNKLCNYLETCKIEGGDYMQLKKAANSDGIKITIIQKQIQKVLIIIKRRLVNQIGFNDIKENCVKIHDSLFYFK